MTRLLYCTIVLWASSTVALAEPPLSSRSSINEERLADVPLFKWMDTLGFPELADRPFVRIVTQNYDDRNVDESLQPRGFLLAENESTFTVFLLDLSIASFVRFGRSQPPQNTVWIPLNERSHRYVELDLHAEADMVGKLLETPVRNFVPGELPSMARHEMTTHRLKACVMARCLAANGNGVEAQRLVDSASVTSQEQVHLTRSELQAGLAQEIAQTLMWQHTLALGDPSLGRPELLHRFRNYVKSFPDCKYTERAVKTVEVLDRMVREDELHAKATKPTDRMSEAEQVAELIFQLRDQNGRQTMQPGGCSIFDDPRDREVVDDAGELRRVGKGSAATQLVKIGYDAVPQLIEHFDDTTLSRSIQFHRDFYFSHRALTVGDCIRIILSRIGDRDIPDRMAAEEWWKEIKQKPERQP